MGVASRCGCKEVIDFLIPTPLVYILLYIYIYLFFFAAASLLFVHLKKFFVLVSVLFCN